MSAPPEEAKASIEAWLAYAADDLLVAARAGELPCIPQAVFFHAQQAAEKALKGYLAWLGDEDVPWTHDLRALARRIAQHGGRAPSSVAINHLAAFTVGIRYPDYIPPTVEEASSALNHPHDIVAHVKAAAGLPADEA